MEFEKYYSSEKSAKWLLKTLANTDKLLRKNKILYWIDGGTLLGQVRNGGMMKWDDDVDIAILGKDINNLFRLKSEFKKLGYGMAWGVGGQNIIKIFDLNGKTIHKPKFRTKGHTGRLEYKYPYLDIAVMNPNNRGTFRYNRQMDEFYEKKYFFKQNEMYTIKRVKFSGILVNRPNKPIPYLDRAYGKNWDKEVYMGFYDHQREKKSKGIKTKMTPFLRKEIYTL